MPKSRNRYARAQARARYRKPRRRKGSVGWTVGLVTLTIVGVVMIGFTVASNRSASAVRPRAGDPTTGAPGDHWHAALDVSICGEKLADAQTFETEAHNPNIRVGIHTHGDGVIHIHPFTSSEAGKSATLGRFFTYGGWDLSSDSFSWWTGSTKDPRKTSWKNGDTCTTPDGKKVKGVVRWSVKGKEHTGNPAGYRPQDQDAILIAFMPKGAKLPAVKSRTPEQDSAAPPAPVGSAPSTPVPSTQLPGSSTPPPSS